MRAVDDAVMKLLRDSGLSVFDGYVQVNNDGKTVEYPLPFVVYYGAIGAEAGRRLTSRRRIHSVGFMVTYVGIDRNQAKAAGEKARTLLSDQRLTLADGSVTGLVTLLTSPWVFRDDDMIRPDGRPVFYGRDTYEVQVKKKQPITEGP